MKSRFLIASLAGAALVMGCKDDTAVYAGGTPGAAVALAISQSAFVFRQADTASIAGQLTDSAGNPVAGDATIASCDPTIVTVAAGTPATGWNGLASVTAVGVGHSCITVTAGALVDTAQVDVGPYALTITGPAAAKSGVDGSADLNPSKAPYIYHVTATDPAGATITAPYFRTWATSGSQNLFAPLSKSGVADSQGTFSNGLTGNTRVTVVALGGATATLSVGVGDGDFTGTVTPSNALTRPAVDNIVLARYAGADPTLTSPRWDNNTSSGTANNNTIFVNGVQTFVTAAGGATGTVTAIIPPTGVNAGTSVPVRIVGIGSTDITQITSAANGNNLTIQNSTGVDGGAPGNQAAATAPNFTIPTCNKANCGGDPPVTFNLSPTTVNYTILSGPCSGAVPNPATGVAGTNCDDWLQITNGLNTSRAISVNLAWFSNANVDLYVYQSDGTTLIAQANTSGNGVVTETVGFTIAGNQVVKVRANLRTQGTNANAPTVQGGVAGARATIVRWQMTVNNN